MIEIHSSALVWHTNITERHSMKERKYRLLQISVQPEMCDVHKEQAQARLANRSTYPCILVRGHVPAASPTPLRLHGQLFCLRLMMLTSLQHLPQLEILHFLDSARATLRLPSHGPENGLVMQCHSSKVAMPYATALRVQPHIVINLNLSPRKSLFILQLPVMQ